MGLRIRPHEIHLDPQLLSIGGSKDSVSNKILQIAVAHTALVGAQMPKWSGDAVESAIAGAL